VFERVLRCPVPDDKYPCRDINIAKAKLEGLFVDELARLQPSPGYMRLVKERVVQVWDRAKSDPRRRPKRLSAGSRRESRPNPRK